MKFAIILDSYPSHEEDQDLLLKNLTTLKSQNIDVFLTSHHSCNSEIIEKCDYFLFEKCNQYYFHDSHIINENIEGITDPIFQRYLNIWDLIFLDRIIFTGWSVSIFSQFSSAISFLMSKGYNYAFYLVGDCLIPENFGQKLEKILEQSIEYDNYFIKNSSQFSNWFLPHFFGFSITQKLANRIPKEDFSDNKIFQKYYPNHSFEDIILKLFGQDKNNIQNHEVINEIFGSGNWNFSSGSPKTDDFCIHYYTTSSIYCSESAEQLILLLYVFADCPFDTIDFTIIISDKNNVVIYNKKINLSKGVWYMENLDHIFNNLESITLTKKLVVVDNSSISYTDTFNIEKKNIDKYSILKRFVKNI